MITLRSSTVCDPPFGASTVQAMLVSDHWDVADSVMVYVVKSTMSPKTRDAGVVSGTSIEPSSIRSNGASGAGEAVKSKTVAPSMLALFSIVMDAGTVTAVVDIDRSF